MCHKSIFRLRMRRDSKASGIPIILAIAAKEGRILVSHDRRTMPIHFGEFIETQISPGIFLVSQDAEIRKVIEDLILIWAASEAEEYVNSIRTLPL